MPKFDPHAAIKRLAEAEWPCHGLDNWPLEGHSMEYRAHQYCAVCNGTGRDAPFASLRRKCPTIGPYYTSHTSDFGLGGQLCPECSGRGWIPEPAVEKACWRIYKVLLNQEIVGWWLDSVRKWRLSKGTEHSRADSEEEAVLRAAEAWVKERRGGD